MKQQQTSNMAALYDNMCAYIAYDSASQHDSKLLFHTQCLRVASQSVLFTYDRQTHLPSRVANLKALPLPPVKTLTSG